MTGPAVDERLRQLVADILDVPANEVGEGLDFTTLPNWSSLQQMMFVSQLESEFGVSLTNQQIRELTTWERARALVSGDPGG